jgi:TPR repeat protein
MQRWQCLGHCTERCLQAKYWYELAAKQGEVNAQCNLGAMLHREVRFDRVAHSTVRST